jgi:hypothetical protein
MSVFGPGGQPVARMGALTGKGSIDVFEGDNTVASLGAGADGGSLVLNDSGGATSVRASTIGSDGEVAVFRSGGQLVAKVSTNSDGQGSFDVIKGALTVASLTAGEGGSLVLNDSSGATAVWVSTLGGNGEVDVFRSGGQLVARMSTNADGQGSFDVVKDAIPVASLTAGADGGDLVLNATGGARSVRAGTISGDGYVNVFRSGGQPAMSIGPGTVGGGAALRIYGNADGPIAAIGADATGNGGLRIANAAGQIVASIVAGPSGGGVYALQGGEPVAGIVSEERTGVVAVYNQSIPVAFLNRSSGGDGGNVTVSLNDGSGVFSAGAAQDGAGEACVFRTTQAGTDRLACVGLGLPSAGMGK